MDVIAVLKEDHKKVEALFKQLEDASERARKTKRRLFQQIATELSLHAAAEEAVLYPRLKELEAPELRRCAFEATEEHRLVKQLIAEIAALLDSGGQRPGDSDGQSEVSDGMGPEWDAKVKVLIDMVRHHVREEEGEIFKDLRAELKRAELVELGEAIVAFKGSHKKDPRAPMPGTGPSKDGAAERGSVQSDKSAEHEPGRGRSRNGVAEQASA